ncbi:hypothetical protein GJ496_008269 [Pomphorhynchus laevis]|nr:hypothetical protein GJ496_008269 [Pomphorhynchus laevis]
MHHLEEQTDDIYNSAEDIIMNIDQSDDEEKRDRIQSLERWRSAELRQPVLIRYLECDDDSEFSTESSNPVLIYSEGNDIMEHTKPIVYREMLDKNTIKSRKGPLPVILERIVNKDNNIPRIRPILIEQWISNRKGERKQPPTTQEEGNIKIKEHKRNFKIIPQYINLGTRKVNVKEYMNKLDEIKGDVTVQSGKLFMKTTEKINLDEEDLIKLEKDGNHGTDYLDILSAKEPDLDYNTMEKTRI